MNTRTHTYAGSASEALILAAGVATVIPFALLTGLAWFAWWPPHWLEPVVLLGVPVMSIPWLARMSRPAQRRHWWGGLVVLVSIWFLASPYLMPGGGLSIGAPARGLAAAIELLFHGGVVWSPYRLAAFATSGVAAVAAVAVASWYTMLGLQWVGERVAANAPARPVRKLSDAAWAGSAEIKDRFSAPGGIVLGEHTDPRRKLRFDPADPARWGRQGKGSLITLDPAVGNAHSLVFSGSGSFKTAGIAIPNALTFAGSLIVIDPKSEIHAVAAPVRARKGRTPWLVTWKDGLDPIRLLTAACPNDTTVFESVAEFLLPTSGDDKSDSSAFFHQKAVRLLSALLAHLYFTSGKNADYFVMANRILALAPDILIPMFESAAEEHGEYPDREFISVGLSEIGHTEPRQLSSVIATVANGLAWAGHASTRGFLASRKPIDGKALLKRVLDHQTDIYLAIPTPVLQANPGIARVLIGSLVRVLRDSATNAIKEEGDGSEDDGPEADNDARFLAMNVSVGDGSDTGEKAEKTPGESGGAEDASQGPVEGPDREVPLKRRLFLIDEARALRRMDTLSNVRDEGRAYGIHLLQIFQSWQQVLECYGPNGAGAWANSVDAVVIGPVSDARQAQELSRMVGRHTVTTSSASRQRSSQLFMPFSGTSGSSESTQLREIELIQPSELRQLPPEAAIILAAGTAPIMASKAIWFTRADMREMVDQAKSGPEPGKPQSTGSPGPDAPVAEDVSAEKDASGSAGPGVPDSSSPGPVEGQGVPVDAAAGQGWLRLVVGAAVRMLGKGPESGSMPGDDRDDGEDSTKPSGDQPREDNEDIPEEDCPAVGDVSDAAADPDLDADEKTVEEVGVGVEGAEGTELETGQDASSSAMDIVAAGIVNRALYTAIVQRSLPTASNAIAEAVLASPAVEIPPGTTARVIQPMALGTGVDHADGWSLVFVPDDGCSPIHRIVFEIDGTIVARLGPYRSGA